MLNTGWNFSTGCQVCDPNWTGEDCDECSENHYGPLCLPCKCALYDHSFDLANEDRYLDCNEGVNGDGTCTIVTSVLDAFWIVVSILAIVVLSNMLMLVNCFARSYQNCTRRCVQSSDNSNPRQNSGPPYSDTKNAETRNDAAVVSCSTTVLLCCTFAAGSVGKLPLRFRRFFVGSTILSLSSFSVMYAVIGQNLALLPAGCLSGMAYCFCVFIWIAKSIDFEVELSSTQKCEQNSGPTDIVIAFSMSVRKVALKEG